MVDFSALKPLRVLHRDAETRSVLPLPKVGAQVYAEHSSTDIIVYCFAFGDEEPWPWYPGEPPPAEVVEHIERGGIVARNDLVLCVLLS